MKITAALLKQMVPRGKGQMINSLVDPLNLVLPAYGITNEYRVAAFLATCAPESDWFATLREYGKGKGRRYGTPDKTTGLVYYGRGIFQNTWKTGYAAFTKYVAENWASIKPRAAKYKYTVPPNFVTDPELLATPYWAVEAACWYWKANGLVKYADRGIKGFFGLQGLVNRGSATKKALHYDARLSSYETARRVFPDDFQLDSAATPQISNSAEPSDQTTASNNSVDASEQPPINTEAVTTTIEQTTAESNTGEAVTSTTVSQEQNVVIETREPEGFLAKTWKKITGAFTGNAVFASISDYAQQIQAFGLSSTFWERLFYIAVGATLVWLIFEAWKHFSKIREEKERDQLLARVNSTETNTVQFATPENIAKFEAAGYKVIKRT